MASRFPKLDSETRAIIDATLERFVNDHYEPAARLARLKRPPSIYRLHWAALAELGVLGSAFAESLGGLGGCAVDIAHTAQVLARGLVLEPLVECAVIAGAVLAAHGDGTQRQDSVDALLGGEQITILLGGQPGAEDGLYCQSCAGAYTVSGKLHVVPYAQQADQWLLAARNRESGDTMIFRIAPRAASWGSGSYRLLDGCPACDIAFDQLALPASSLWLKGTDADAALARAGLLATAAYGSEAAGILAQLVSVTGSYLTTRVQFGVTLSNFQALQHRYADMHMESLECGALTRAYAAAIDQGDPHQLARLSAALPIVVARGPARVGQEAIQMHGGMGLTEELIVSHYNARLVVLSSRVAAWAAPAATPLSGATA